MFMLFTQKNRVFLYQQIFRQQSYYIKLLLIFFFIIIHIKS